MPELKKAQQQLEYLSHDESLRFIAVQHEKARMDHTSSLNRAEKKGILQGEKWKQMEIAKNLLALGVLMPIILQSTGLTTSERMELQSNLSPLMAASTNENE